MVTTAPWGDGTLEYEVEDWLELPRVLGFPAEHEEFGIDLVRRTTDALRRAFGLVAGGTDPGRQRLFRHWEAHSALARDAGIIAGAEERIAIEGLRAKATDVREQLDRLGDAGHDVLHRAGFNPMVTARLRLTCEYPEWFNPAAALREVLDVPPPPDQRRPPVAPRWPLYVLKDLLEELDEACRIVAASGEGGLPTGRRDYAGDQLNRHVADIAAHALFRVAERSPSRFAAHFRPRIDLETPEDSGSFLNHPTMQAAWRHAVSPKRLADLVHELVKLSSSEAGWTDTDPPSARSIAKRVKEMDLADIHGIKAFAASRSTHHRLSESDEHDQEFHLLTAASAERVGGVELLHLVHSEALPPWQRAMALADATTRFCAEGRADEALMELSGASSEVWAAFDPPEVSTVCATLADTVHTGELLDGDEIDAFLNALAVRIESIQGNEIGLAALSLAVFALAVRLGSVDLCRMLSRALSRAFAAHDAATAETCRLVEDAHDEVSLLNALQSFAELVSAAPGGAELPALASLIRAIRARRWALKIAARVQQEL